MKRCLLILTISGLVSGFTWPWQQVPQKEEKKPAQEEQEPKTVAYLPDAQSEEKILIEGETPKTEDTTLPVALPIYKPAFKPITPLPPRSSVVKAVPVPAKSVTSLPAKAVEPPIDTSIVNLQKQINDIIKLNESIQRSQQTQVIEIQRIMEQARIHQRILAELKEREGREDTAKPSDAEALLREEKVRLIREQTEKNREMIAELKKTFEAEEIPSLEPGEVDESTQTEETEESKR